MLDEVPLNDQAHGFASRSVLLPKGDVDDEVEESANVAVTINCSAPLALDVPSMSQISPVAESTVAPLVVAYSMMKLAQVSWSDDAFDSCPPSAFFRARTK